MSAENRGLQGWRSVVSTLPDGPFFDLMRGYLGDIKTPFNKQRLVAELEAFLGRRDVLETIAALLDATDLRILSAIDYLSDPSAEDLSAFFADEFSYAELYAVLLNLEERLLLYRYLDDGRRQLAVNPLLAGVLEPRIREKALLFPDFPRSGPAVSAAGATLDDACAATVVGFLLARTELLKADGRLKKKVADAAAATFPDPGNIGRFTAAVDALRILGLVRSSPSEIGLIGSWIDDDRLSALAELSAAERRWYYAAAACAARLGFASTDDGDSDGEPAAAKPSTHLSYRRQRDRAVVWAKLFKLTLSRLELDREYADATIGRLLESCRRDLASAQRRRPEIDHDFRFGIVDADFRRAALAALIDAGALERTASDRLALRILPAPPERPAIGFDSAFAVFVYPEMDFSEAIALARFLDLREAGTVSRWELTRASAVRAFDGGALPDELIAHLEQLAGKQAPPNLAWSLRDWYERYSSVALHRGAVLVVAESRRYLLDAPGVAALITKTLAPGVVLLSADADEAIVAALAKAGADIVAAPRTVPERSPEARAARSFLFPPLDSPAPVAVAAAAVVAVAVSAGSPPLTEASFENVPLSPALSVDARLHVLREALSGKKLSKDRHDELTARIGRRVIVAESQLSGAAVRYEKLEASGLDYIGKVRVAEQALATGSLVEAHWRGPKGEPNRVLGLPQALDKRGGEVDLIINEEPRGRRLSIPIGKISLIRRLKRSMFGE